MAREYAVTRALDAGTGDILLSGSTWKAGQPATEIVLRVLRTPKGSYAGDPTFGVNYGVLQKAKPSVQADWKAAVEEGLSFLVKSGRISNLVVEVDPPRRIGATTQLLYQVTFVDPRASTRDAQTLRLAA